MPVVTVHRSPRATLAAAAACLVLFVAPSAHAAACSGSATFGADFVSLYSCSDIGRPDGLSDPLGGIAFLNASTLLVGGLANGPAGEIRAVGVVRDAGGHITGFSAPSAPYAAAPFIDGGLAFGPGGVLFATGYPNNTLLQFLPGSTSPDKTVDLSTVTAPVSPSVGALAFVPAGFAGAGQMKIVSFNTGFWYTATLTPDGSGTYDVTAVFEAQVNGGPEGMVYIDGANDGFGGVDSVLVAEWASNRVGVYEIDANGDPIAATRRDFMSGLSGAEGAAIDPLTGDFLFSTFAGAGGDRLYVISGFVAPPPPGDVPEPASTALIALALLGAAAASRRRAPAAAATA